MQTLRRRTELGLLAGLVGAFALGYGLAGVRADGVPKAQPLWYSGTVADAAGKPLDSNYNITMRLFERQQPQAGETPVCSVDTKSTRIANGRFRIDVSECASALQGNPDLFVELTIGDELDVGKPFERAKIGAVPFALEAQHAVSASAATGTLAQQIVPSGMIGMFASACPVGWVACDGSGACPNLHGAYVKGGTAFAAQAGSNTHSHTVSGLTASAASAGTPITSVVSSAGAHNHVAMAEYSGNFLYENAARTFLSGGNANVAVPSWTSNYRIQGAANWEASAGLTANIGTLTTTEAAHSHSVTLQELAPHSHAIPSFSTAATNHEPRNVTLVLCMKS